MRNKTVSLGIVLAVLVAVQAAEARDFTEEDFLAVGERLVRSMNELDYEGFLSLAASADDGEEMSEADWRRQREWVTEKIGKIQEVIVEELDPPDGAYLTFNAAQGAIEVFMVLDEEGKVSEMRAFPKGQSHAGCGTSPPP